MQRLITHPLSVGCIGLLIAAIGRIITDNIKGKQRKDIVENIFLYLPLPFYLYFMIGIYLSVYHSWGLFALLGVALFLWNFGEGDKRPFAFGMTLILICSYFHKEILRFMF